ncbi:hypothetical protein CDL12_21987 [Handroanthus impetiginosus]|uniref:RING-CH-type domain-containing protein n=1 Tax=Handroanthus impetiginosus TaxID=429701 RepID=A0A2G9GJL0_9LAMI|nr:hypothetical protein CDL12_21987 [Handroanthus impetiginosus]
MEAEISDEVDKNSRNQEENKKSDGEEEKREEFVVDVKGDVNNGGSRNSESSRSEKMCRICHFGSEEYEIVLLGCDCRGELGFAHLHCAEVWFAQRRDRLCEICGKTAKNITSINAEETSILVMEMRLVAASLDASRERSRRCQKSLCNFLMACLVLAFVLPWFFRGMDVF